MYRLIIFADGGEIMAVSLKKSSDISKVDLSKPVANQKLPECTPVHLIDEEETIKRVVGDLRKVRLFDETDKKRLDILADSEPKHNKNKIFHFIAWLCVSLLVIADCVAIFLLIVNLPEPVEQPEEVSAAFDILFSLVSCVFSNPIVIMIICATIALSVVKRINNITK